MTWKLAQQRIELSTGALCLAVELARPAAGLRDVVFDGHPLPELRPLQLTAHPPVAAEAVIESYVRESDCVVTYAQLPERTVRPQYAFRLLNADELGDQASCGVELLIGLQTSLLESDPTCSNVTEAAVEQVLALGRDDEWTSLDQPCQLDDEQFLGAVLFRLQHPEISYVELVFPADFRGAQLTLDDGAARLGYQMFPEFLEKGVIRKGRIWAVLTPARRS